MGNRAVITTRDGAAYPCLYTGVYLHWNGGRDSVEAFLAYCKLQGYRSPEADPEYGYARLIQTIANFFGGSGSIGINIVNNMDYDNGDNGMYIIKNWEIIERRYAPFSEQKDYDLFEMLMEIDKSQPEKIQLGEAKIREYVERKEGKKDGNEQVQEIN